MPAATGPARRPQSGDRGIDIRIDVQKNMNLHEIYQFSVVRHKILQVEDVFAKRTQLALTCADCGDWPP
jgi:hypothetical protein